MLGRMVSGNDTAGWGGWSAASGVSRLKPAAIGLLGLLVAIGAYLAAQVVVLDGSAYFNRPGPRLVDSLEALVAAR